MENIIVYIGAYKHLHKPCKVRGIIFVVVTSMYIIDINQNHVQDSKILCFLQRFQIPN